MAVVDVADRIPERTGEWTVEDGRVTVTKRKFGRVGTGFARLLGVSPDLRITLDALGSVAWQEMDGRTVAQVLHVLEERFPEEGRLEARLGEYLERLARTGMIRFRATSTEK